MSDHALHSYWWQTSIREPVHSSLWQHVEYLEEVQTQRKWVDRTLWQMYENELYTTKGPYAAALTQLAQQGFQSARLNVSRSVTDTLVAKVGKRPPAVKVTPDDAVYSLKKKAKGLTRFLRAKNERMELDQLMPLVLRDACVVGTGCVKTYERWGEVYAERVPKEELYVDPRESRYGEPRQLHQKKQYPREVLCELFPKKSSAILMAPDAENDDVYNTEYQSGDTNMVEVVESWHLRSGPDAKDGRHAIIINGETLLYEKWDEDRFPISFLRFSPRRFGFWGTGLLEQGAEIQAKIDAIMQDILESLYYGSQTRVLAPRRANLNKNHTGRQRRPYLVEYDGNIPPVIDAPNPVSKDAMSVLEFLVDQYHELAGISQLETAAKNPLGANASGAALAEWYDIRSERYQQIENGYAQCVVDIDLRAIDVARAIAESEGGYSAKWCDQNTMQRIEWSEVDMDADQFNLIVEPTGFLPDTISGKLDAIERLAKMGVLDGNAIASLLMDAPDLAKANATQSAPQANLERVMEELADEDAPMPVPEPIWNLELADTMARNEYNRAQSEGAPEEVLQRFLDFLDNVDALSGQAEKIAAQMNAQGAPAPMQDPSMAGQPPMPMEGGAPPPPEALPPGPAPGSLPGQALPGIA